MRAFEYASPISVAEAVELLGAEGAAVLAGGTDLLSLMKDRVEAPTRLVSLKKIQGLRALSYNTEAGLTAGAMVSLDELATHQVVRRLYPALVQAVEGVRSPQIQAMGSVGGDLLQRPRCWYYRNGFGLLALAEDAGGSGGSMVEAGDNRYHAILGNDGPAHFVNPSSLAPALIALGAEVTLTGPGGDRRLPVAELYRVPAAGQRELTLGPAEILTAVRVPPPAQGATSATYEVRHRSGLDWPLAAAAAAFTVAAGKVRDARLVLGHVAPVPWPVPRAAAVLEGKAVGEELAAAAADAAEIAVAGARPLSRNRYKIQLARTAARRAILGAAGMEV